MFAFDTHIHTCLSPCAELDMHPAALVDAAARAGLDAIAVCDHNSAENAGAVERAGRPIGLAVIPGMEITSAEEVHILGLLPDLEAAMVLQSEVYRALPGENVEDVFGTQVIANEFAEVLGFNDHRLAGASILSLDKVVDAIHDVDGLAMASHVDREGFGIIGQLGFIPAELGLDAIEVSPRTALPQARISFAPKGEYSILCASDAHEPKDVGRSATFMFLEAPTLAELKKALAGVGGRAILGGGRPMEDLALHILDIAQNSLEAGAETITIEISEDPEDNRLVIEVCDNGRGMGSATITQVTDPFFTTRPTRSVGLGLSLLAAAARTAGGSIVIDSKPGQGSRVKATFKHGHIDRAPLGDIETTLMILLTGHPDKRVCFQHRVKNREFKLDSRDFHKANIDPTSPAGMAILRETIRGGEDNLNSCFDSSDP